MIQQMLHLTSDEAAELEMLMKRETASAAVELRHTQTRDYRDRIRHRIELLEAILQKLESPTPTQPVA